MPECKVCFRPLFEPPLLEFRNMPAVAQNFPDSSSLASDSGIGFAVRQCSGCGLVQLASRPVPYYRDVIRAAAFSPAMLEFRRGQFADFLDSHHLKGKRLVEIGCGCGEYLALMREAGAEVCGIEHNTDATEECRKNGLEVTGGYLESEQTKIPGGPFDGFFIMSFLEHIPDINSFLGGITSNLTENGTGLVEVPNFEMILREQLISEFMTDHLWYFTKDTLKSTLQLNGFDVISCREIWHDYILSAVVRKKKPLSLSGFERKEKQIQEDIDSFLAKFPEKSAVIWGAGHQALAAISLYGLKDHIAYVVDSAPFKQGRFTPATHLPVQSPDCLKADPSIRAVIVMGAGYSDEISAMLAKNFDKNLTVSILRPDGLEPVSSL